MAYRVVMELIPRPDDIEEWIWNEPDGEKANSFGGKAWTAKLNVDDTVWEYSTKSAANNKMSSLESADSTNRRYKVIEV